MLHSQKNIFLPIFLLTIIFSNLYSAQPPLATKNQISDDKTVNDTPNSQKEIYKWLRTVSEVVDLVDKKAFRDVDFAQFIQESLKAAVPQVDAHSAFFPAESYKATMESTSGEFSGIGVSIINKTPEDDSLVIVDVIQAGPAEKGGLKSGDKIVEIDGAKLRGLSTDEVISKLKGKIGTEVNLKLIREKKPLEFKIKRDTIKDQTSLCYYFKDQNIYYLSLKLFTETAAKQMSELLQKANSGKCKGIVLDLRRNPGGILESAVDMAGLFIDKGSLVVTTKDKDGKVTSSYKTTSNPVLKSDIPIFILIDNFTASASEIMAGCLKYYSETNATSPNKNQKKLMVFLVGTPSFGKGSVQEVIPISNGCALKLTTMLYFLPNDVSIQAIGIKPDFTIKPKTTPADEIKWINDLYGKESSLKYHITQDEIKNKKQIAKKAIAAKKEEEKEKSWEEKQQEAIMSDVQIQASINLINLLNLAQKSNPEQVSTRQKALSFLKSNYLTDDPIEIEKVK